MSKSLGSWNCNTLSLGGREVILKSVSTGIPTYFFSFYKAPEKVINLITKMQRNFFWGGNSENRKIAWVSWDTICKSKEDGGIGVKNLKWFNYALLGKWRWRLINGDDALWKRIICAKYGNDRTSNGTLQNWFCNNKSSIWWRDIASISSKNGEEDWFSQDISKVLGNGKNTLFWEDVWLGEIALKVRFQRLYSVSRDKGKSVSSLGRWNDGAWEWNFTWRRSFFEWEKQELNDLLTSIQQVRPAENISDSWNWKLDPSGKYAVKSAYNKLNQTQRGEGSEFFKEFWAHSASSKTSLFAWKMIMDRIPTKVNLANRGVALSNVEMMCCFCEAVIETTTHIMFECPFSHRVLMLFYDWFDVTTVLINSPITHFQHHSELSSNLSCKSVWKGLWCIVVGTIWTTRNKVQFEAEVPDVLQALELIKAKSWYWIKATNDSFTYSFIDWYNSPRYCCIC